MKNSVVSLCMGLAVLCSAAQAVQPAAARAAAVPARDLTVELRQILEDREEGKSVQEAAQHYSVGTESSRDWEPQSVQVRNGEKALLHVNDAIPMQWTQSVSTQSPSSNGSAGNSQGNTGPSTSVNNALVWFDAGQSISVQAKWPGGSKPAVLVIEVQRAALAPYVGATLPQQTRNTLSTTVTVPLAEWVTIAATGKSAKAGVYSSDAGVLGRRLLQVRVMVP